MGESRIRNPNAGCGSMPVFDKWGKTETRGTLSRKLRDCQKRIVVQRTDEVRFYVSVASWRKKGSNMLCS